MSPELETLDQLLGGDLSLTAIQKLYPSFHAFRRSVLGLLECGDFQLVAIDGKVLEEWNWNGFLDEHSTQHNLHEATLSLTAQGAARFA